MASNIFVNMKSKRWKGVLVLMVLVVMVLSSFAAATDKYWSNEKGDIKKVETKPEGNYFEIKEGLYNHINSIKKYTTKTLVVNQMTGATATFENDGRKITTKWNSEGGLVSTEHQTVAPPVGSTLATTSVTAGQYIIDGRTYSKEQLKAMDKNPDQVAIGELTVSPEDAKKLSAVDGKNFVYNGDVYKNGNKVGEDKVPSFIEASEIDFSKESVNGKIPLTKGGFVKKVNAENKAEYYRTVTDSKPYKTVGKKKNFFKEEETNKITLRDQIGRPLVDFNKNDYNSIIGQVGEDNILAVKARAEQYGFSLNDFKNRNKVENTEVSFEISNNNVKVTNKKNNEELTYDQLGRFASQKAGEVTTTFSYNNEGAPATMEIKKGGSSLTIQQKADAEGRQVLAGPKIEGYDELYWVNGELHGKNFKTKQIEEIPLDKQSPELKALLKQGKESRDKWSEDTYGTRDNLDAWRFGVQQFYPGISAIFREFDFYQKFTRQIDFWLAKYFDTDFWTSRACESVLDFEPPPGTASVELPGGIKQAVAHIEAERSSTRSPITCLEEPPEEEQLPEEQPCKQGQCQDGLCYKDEKVVEGRFYKITWAVRAPNDPNLAPFIDQEDIAIKYNIGLKKGSENSVVAIWLMPAEGTGDAHTLKLKLGETDRSAYVAYSPEEYDFACIIWGAAPVTRGGLSPGGEELAPVCARFVDSSQGEVNWKRSGEEESGTPSTRVSDVGTKKI